MRIFPLRSTTRDKFKLGSKKLPKKFLKRWRRVRGWVSWNGPI